MVPLDYCRIWVSRYRHVDHYTAQSGPGWEPTTNTRHQDESTGGECGHHPGSDHRGRDRIDPTFGKGSDHDVMGPTDPRTYALLSFGGRRTVRWAWSNIAVAVVSSLGSAAIMV
jgi:hypothetical protein